MKYIFVSVFAILVLQSAGQNSNTSKLTVTLAFYNTENLFDIIDDKSEGDDEFLPSSLKVWDKDKYEKKLKDLAGALGSINEKELPALIGLAEIENKKVLDDLIKQQSLRKGKYEIIHFDSPDERGIDVALLFRPDKLTVIESRAIPVTFSFSPSDKTRDILYVKGTMDDGKTYHIYINHWPSRSGEAVQSEMRRMLAAAALRKDIDIVTSSETDPRIIIMGDFNDEPTNKSLMQVLNATNKRVNAGSRDLYNLMYDAHNIDNEGTISYQGEWDMFDHIIVSYPLLANKGGYYTDYMGGKIHRPDNLLFVNTETGVVSPNRTYGGNEYFGGTSDHLPVFVILKMDSPGK